MISNFVHSAGPWAWWIFGIVLLVAEVALPGNFLIWVGVAGVLTGALSNLFWETSWWGWQVQWLVFAVLSGVCLFIGRNWLKRSGARSEEPTLNDRGASLVGRTTSLADPIVNGRGRVRIGDAFWTVSGPELPAGTKVKIVGSEGSGLKVEAL
ncbi:NfeD family protein [Rhizobium sp. KVB221]|uniref:NfeD family protein n=1 Tax=Rhizobium setariae TaxID=2801340 RepID=A0A936YS94_9HYPH|nr:NfeD family protein [Rhizobium setariae]MBL0371712.1 NfeD family protein [Rhizobium setariae]